jgi:hypothetical protein
MQKLLTRLAGHSYTPVTQKLLPRFVLYLGGTMQIKSKNSKGILKNRMPAGVSILFFKMHHIVVFP